MPVDTHEDIMPAAGIEGPNVVETHEDIQPAMGVAAYHGSPHEFDMPEERFSKTAAYHYLADSPETAKKYGKNLYRSEIHPKNLIEFDPENIGPKQMKVINELADRLGEDPEYLHDAITGASGNFYGSKGSLQDQVMHELRDMGHDAFRFPDVTPGGGWDMSTVVLDPSIIKKFERQERAYGGAIAGPKLTEENAEDFARRLILWSYAAAPFVNRSIHRATGGEVDPSVDQALDAARGASQADPAASAMETARSLTPMGFYSAAAEAASKIPQRAPIDQIINKVKGAPGVKAEELDWSGVKDAFAGQRSVDPQEVARHFQENLPALQETVKEDPDTVANRMAQKLAREPDQKKAYEIMDQMKAVYDPSWRKEHGAIYNGYTLLGGANYREVLLHLPKYEPENINEVNDKRRDIYKKTADAAEEWRKISEESGAGHPDALAAYRRFADIRKEKENFEKQFKNLTTDIDSKNYKSSHWNVPNVVAHLRLSDRDMGKTLHLEELQSDWGQEGRDQGFGGRETTGWRAEPTGEPGGGMYVFDQNNRQIGYAPATHSETERDAINHVASFIKGPPKGPHVTSNEGWTDLGLKRALQEAAKGGYKELIWTPGQEQADRYDLSSQVKHIMWSPDNKILSALTHDNSEAIGERVEKEDLHKYIGKEAAKKLLDQEPEMDGNMATHHLRGQAISVGGEGMKNYYDRFLPGRLQKLVSKLDPEAKVQLYGHRMFVPDEREGDSEEGEYKNVHSLKITPKLRAAILKGLPAYKQGGFATNSAPIVNKALDVVSGLRR